MPLGSWNSMTLWGWTIFLLRRANVFPHTRAPKGQESICNWHCRGVEQCFLKHAHAKHVTKVTFLLRHSISYTQHTASADPPSQCLSNGLLLFWEAVTRSVLDLPCSRLLWLLASKAAVLGDLGQGPWPLGFIFYSLFWCQATCELHNNLTQPLWKHGSHKWDAQNCVTYWLGSIVNL